MNIKYLSKDGLIYLWNLIKLEVDTKVDKVSGKALSTNDYSTTEKNKLTSIETSAEVNIIESVKVNGGTAIPITSKSIDIDIPTKVSQLSNDSSFATTTLVSTKVDKISGKGLSVNDYTTVEKTKLTGIANNANNYVHPNTSTTRHVTDTEKSTWNTKVSVTQLGESVEECKAYTDSNAYVHPTSVFMTQAEKTKLSGIETSAEVNIIESVKINGGTALSITSKSIDIDIPTKVSQLSNDSSFATTTLVSTKVDKIAGKNLSTNDYTSAEKTKLLGIETGSEKNIIEQIKLNNVAISPSARSVNLSVITPAQVDSKILSAIADLTSFRFEIVTALPTTGQNNIIYLVPKSASTSNVYDEWSWINNKWEKIGSTDIDLSGYIQKTHVVAISNAEIDSVLAM